jgi:uncharacterized protein YndB with AHSA1/START domain
VTDQYAVTVRRDIAAPAEALFDAWLDADSLGLWLRPTGIRETRAETDPREGGTFRIVMVDDESSSLLHAGTYREIDRPHRLVFTWSSAATHFRDSIVTVTFHPSSSNSTLVEIHQVGLPDEEAQASHHGGWTDALHELAGAIGPRHARGERTDDESP